MLELYMAVQPRPVLEL